jgi:hypothetical protein
MQIRLIVNQGLYPLKDLRRQGFLIEGVFGEQGLLYCLKVMILQSQ